MGKNIRSLEKTNANRMETMACRDGCLVRHSLRQQRLPGARDAVEDDPLGRLDRDHGIEYDITRPQWATL